MDVLKELETERLLIRQFIETDQEAFISFMTNPEITKNLAFDDFIKTKEGALHLLNQTISSYSTENPMLAFAIIHKATGSVAGVCGTGFLQEEVAEVFYAFFPNFWGKGFATETLSAIIKYLAQTGQVKEIHAFIAQQNITSMRVVEKAGFTNTGLVEKENFINKVFDYVLTI